MLHCYSDRENVKILKILNIDDMSLRSIRNSGSKPARNSILNWRSDVPIIQKSTPRKTSRFLNNRAQAQSKAHFELFSNNFPISTACLYTITLTRSRSFSLYIYISLWAVHIFGIASGEDPSGKYQLRSRIVRPWPRRQLLGQYNCYRGIPAAFLSLSLELPPLREWMRICSARDSAADWLIQQQQQPCL